MRANTRGASGNDQLGGGPGGGGLGGNLGGGLGGVGGGGLGGGESTLKTIPPPSYRGTKIVSARDATVSCAMGSACCLSFDSAVTSHATMIWCAASTLAWALPQYSQPLLLVRMMCNSGSVKESREMRGETSKLR